MAKKSKISYPTKFTINEMISHVALKNNISKSQAKVIWEDVFDVISNGVLKGERTPVGNFGKMYIKIKPATKARKGRNPLTGEEITIKAKPATKVPKFTFSKNYKELSKKAKVKKS